MFKRRPVRDLSVQRAGELPFVIGVQLRVVTPPRDGHVRQSLVHKLLAGAFRLNMHKDAAGRLALAAVARNRVAVIEMAALARLE